MDGQNNGKPYEQMDDFGGFPHIFGSTPKWQDKKLPDFGGNFVAMKQVVQWKQSIFPLVGRIKRKAFVIQKISRITMFNQNRLR